MFALDSTAHGLVDPTRTTAVLFCALSATLFFLFFILLDGHNPSAFAFFFGLVRAAYRGHLDALAGAAPTYFALAVLGASLGLIASIVRYRRPIRSTFTVVTAGPFVGMALYLLGLFIPFAFASLRDYGAGLTMMLVFWPLATFCIFGAVFSSCAVGGCIAGHIIQERSKRWVASPALPSLATLAVGMTGCAAALASTFWL